MLIHLLKTRKGNIKDLRQIIFSANGDSLKLINEENKKLKDKTKKSLKQKVNEAKIKIKTILNQENNLLNKLEDSKNADNVKKMIFETINHLKMIIEEINKNNFRNALIYVEGIIKLNLKIEADMKSNKYEI